MICRTKVYLPFNEKKRFRAFNRLISFMEPAVEIQYGYEGKVFRQEVRAKFGKILSGMRWGKGIGCRIFNKFLIMTAEQLSVYKVLKKHGQSPGEVWVLCHKALQRRCKGIPSWKRSLYKACMINRLTEMVINKRARHGIKDRFGDFIIEYVEGGGDEFDFGINYLRCANLHLATQEGCREFAPYICMTNIVLSDSFGWGLQRTQTLADGCSYCDFRFKKGAPTRVSSKTPQVQQIIEQLDKVE